MILPKPQKGRPFACVRCFCEPHTFVGEVAGKRTLVAICGECAAVWQRLGLIDLSEQARAEAMR